MQLKVVSWFGAFARFKVGPFNSIVFETVRSYHCLPFKIMYSVSKLFILSKIQFASFNYHAPKPISYFPFFWFKITTKRKRSRHEIIICIQTTASLISPKISTDLFLRSQISHRPLHKLKALVS